MRIQRVAHAGRAPSFLSDRYARPARSVYAGIGAPRAADFGVFAAKSLNRLHDHILHAEMLALRLPAGKRRAVIFDGELVSRQVCPAGMEKPRNKSSAVIGCLPARCRIFRRTAPCRRQWSVHCREPCLACRLWSAISLRSTLMRSLLKYEPGARKRRQAANVVVNFKRRLVPVDFRLCLFYFMCIGDATARFAV